MKYPGRKSFAPIQGVANANPDVDLHALSRALREIPPGIMTEDDFRAWLEGPLRRFFPFERFYGAYGRLSGRRAQVHAILSSGHGPEYLASRDSAFEVKRRSTVEWWIAHRRGLLLDKTVATDTAGARFPLSDVEIDDISRFSLGTVAATGVYDPFANAGAYMGFSGVPTNRMNQTLAALELIAPIVYTLYLRTKEIVQAAGLTSLADRQRDLIDLATLGLSDKAIALRLGISEHTVGNHFRAIYAKLCISKRSQLVALVK